MLLKNIFFLGFAVLTAASPILDARAGTTSTGAAVGGKTGGAKGKGAAQCKNQSPLQGPVTCPRDKFTAAQITQAVKQAKAMKLKGKTGKGLHFPARYRPKKETKVKGAKGMKGKASKAVKRDGEKDEDKDEDKDGDEHQALEARRSRGGGSRASRPRPKPVRKTRPTKKPTKKPAKKPTKKPTTKKPTTKKPTTKKPTTKCTAAQKKANGGKCPATKKPTTCTAAQKKANGGKCPATCTAAQKKANGGKCPAKDPCANAKPIKPGKGVYMFPILEKGVWKPGTMVEVNYIILDAKYNYVKTVERAPGAAEEYEVCAEQPKAKGGKATGGKGGKGTAV